MNLGILNETVILIDTDFLNERMNHNLDFYRKLYPNKKFKKINLADLLYTFVINARVEEAGHKVDILFSYTLNNSILTNCEPNDVFGFIDSKQVQIETEKGTFLIRSFFGDEDETSITNFVKMLRILNHSTTVSRIIMVADNHELNPQLEVLVEEKDKSLFVLKKHHLETEIDADVKYVNIDYTIAYALGLNDSEI
ncbi:MAG: hypothetical protein K9G46_06030 [Flavobacteriales bacterium]|nr:hypothetical protein [Flavobacteriales bacterium]